MRILPFSLAAAAALALAACGDEVPKPQTSESNAPASSAPSTASSSPGGSSTSTGSSAAPSSSTGVSQSSEKMSGAADPGTDNVHQQQVDPKDNDQRRDFQQSGDAKGPTSPSTQPKPGN